MPPKKKNSLPQDRVAKRLEDFNNARKSKSSADKMNIVKKTKARGKSSPG